MDATTLHLATLLVGLLRVALHHNGPIAMVSCRVFELNLGFGRRACLPGAIALITETITRACVIEEGNFGAAIAEAEMLCTPCSHVLASSGMILVCFNIDTESRSCNSID